MGGRAAHPQARKGQRTPSQRLGASPDPGLEGGRDRSKLDLSDVESLSTEWLPAAHLLAYFLFPAVSPPGEAVLQHLQPVV